jgi:Tfp pilus assembly protein PilF
MYRKAALSTLALIIFSGLSLAQSSQFPAQQRGMSNSHDAFNSLSGSVRSADDKPLKDVRVELREADTGNAVGSVYSNASGNFEFSHLRTGIYEVVATSGLQEVHDRVEITAMGNMVNLRLPISTVANDGNGRNTISVAQFKVPGKARDELKKAREAISKQKPEEAQKHLAKALEIYPKFADALTLRGILKLDSKDSDGAIADLQQAIEYDGNCALAYLVMGAVFNTKGKFDDAIRALQRGEALTPNSWQASFELGKAYVGKLQYEDALRQLNKAQALSPSDYPLIHLVKAHAMLAMNSYGDAMDELQQYLQKDPKGPNSAQAEKMLAQAKAYAANHPAK